MEIYREKLGQSTFLRARVADPDVEDLRAMELEMARRRIPGLAPRALCEAIPNVVRPRDPREIAREPSDSRAGWAAEFKSRERCRGQEVFDWNFLFGIGPEETLRREEVKRREMARLKSQRQAANLRNKRDA